MPELLALNEGWCVSDCGTLVAYENLESVLARLSHGMKPF